MTMQFDLQGKPGETLAVKVYGEVGSMTLLAPEGYGDCSSQDGKGAPIMLSVDPDTGALMLHVWADINQEDPTHVSTSKGRGKIDERTTMTKGHWCVERAVRQWRWHLAVGQVSDHDS